MRRFSYLTANMALVSVLLVGCGGSNSSNGSEDNSTEETETTEVSAADVYEERVRLLTGMLGMTESELVAYSVACGIVLGDVSVPFSYVTDVLMPVLTPEQFNQSLSDTLQGIEKPRCLYAQGG